MDFSFFLKKIFMETKLDFEKKWFKQHWKRLSVGLSRQIFTLYGDYSGADASRPNLSIDDRLTFFANITSTVTPLLVKAQTMKLKIWHAGPLFLRTTGHTVLIGYNN